MRITTPRISLQPLSFAQLQLCLTNLPALEAELGLPILREVLDENLTRALGIKIAKMENLPLEKHPWQTYWLIVIPNREVLEAGEPGRWGSRVGAGFIGFKGYLNEAGEAEIGYGIAPQYQGQGYTTEAVRALCTWAFTDPACRAITATTVVNPASNRVLYKVGAQIFKAHAGQMDWKIFRAGFKCLGSVTES